MLHFIAFLEFLVAIVVFALGLALGLSSSGFPGWPIAIILLLTAGVLSLLVVIVAHLVFGGFTRPLLCVGLLHIITFAFDLAVFIVALTYPPYINGCSTSTSKGCQMERAAIGLDGVLWILFFISGMVLCADSVAYSTRGAAGAPRVSRYYY